MGISREVICEQCGCKFAVCSGGGFMFHDLRCNQCGQSTTVSFDDLGEIHFAYLKGLGGPYALATRERDQFIRENFPGEAISEDEYHKAVEAFAGKCNCGGQFTFDAPAMCPECRSMEFKEDPDGEQICYD